MNAEQKPKSLSANSSLFLGFLRIGMIGFGGIAPWARHVIVEERGWLNDAEYAELLGVGQILPGPNTMNLSIIMGDRFNGVAGSLMCLLGQMAVPLVIIVILATLYQHVATSPDVRAALHGAAAAAAGLIVGTALKMLRKVRTGWFGAIVAVGIAATIGLLRWSMIPVVLVALTASTPYFMWKRP